MHSNCFSRFLSFPKSNEFLVEYTGLSSDKVKDLKVAQIWMNGVRTMLRETIGKRFEFVDEIGMQRMFHQSWIGEGQIHEDEQLTAMLEDDEPELGRHRKYSN